jgi:predicted RNA-binding Zn-ribbon protein involved in translation (DUF1610 family)
VGKLETINSQNFKVEAKLDEINQPSPNAQFCNRCGKQLVPLAGKVKYVCPDCAKANRQRGQKLGTLKFIIKLRCNRDTSS